MFLWIFRRILAQDVVLRGINLFHDMNLVYYTSSNTLAYLLNLIQLKWQEVEKRELENFLDESFLSEVSAQLRQVRISPLWIWLVSLHAPGCSWIIQNFNEIYKNIILAFEF